MNKPLIHLLQLKEVAIYDQLRLEEALLRIDVRNWCLLNKGSYPSIVMGISGKPEALVEQTLMANSPVPLVKRFSGGGTVYVDQDTHFVTWIGNVDDLGVPCCPCKIHANMIDFYRRAFPQLPIELRENDYVIDQRKWGGNAQYLTKGRWLHHTSMLWDFSAEQMKRLLMPPKMPLYRSSRSHEDFLCRLSDFLPDREEIEDGIVRQLSVKFRVVSADLADVLPVLEREHRRVTSLLSFGKE